MAYLNDLDSGMKLALSIAGSAIALWVLIAKSRKRVRAFFAVIRHHLTIGDTVLAELRAYRVTSDAKFAELNAAVASNAALAETLRSELQWNGGSTVKDNLARLNAYHRLILSDAATPTFEFDALLHNHMVSESYCRLLRADSTDLLAANWFQFAVHSALSEYLAAVREAVAAGAAVRATMTLVDSDAVNLGEWEMSAMPVGTPTVVRYMGRLRPVCARAREIAEARGIPVA